MRGFADLSLELSGFPIRRAIRDLDEIYAQSAKHSPAYLSAKAQEIFEFHVNNNYFYQNLVSEKGGIDFKSAPVLTKQDFQRPLQERLSSGFSIKNVYVNKTSGSSGEPFIFAKDPYCHALTWAFIKQQFGEHNIDFNLDLQARFYGIPLEGWPKFKEKTKDFLMNRERFPVFDLSDSVLAQYVNRFKTKRFTYVNGYTSSLVLFAKYLKREQLILKEICPTLKAVFTTSEMLFPDDRLLMESVFGVKIVNEYGASELDLIAFEDVSGEWIMNDKTLLIEVLDDSNKALPFGEIGRIVITSLYNKAHPFIRYDIGDNGVLAFDADSNQVVLKKLIGRTNDVAILPSGKKVPGLTFYYVTKSIIQESGNVKEFIIQQTAADRFLITYVSTIPLTDIEKSEILAANERYLGNGLHFDFERKDQLERSRSGKLKQFSISEAFQ